MEERYYEILEAETGRRRNEINESMSFKDDFGMSSLNIAMLYPKIEDEFNITFSPLEDDLGEIFKNVGSLLEFIKTRGYVK